MRILLLALGVLLITAAPALAAPNPSYEVSGGFATQGRTETFTSTSTTSDPGETIILVEWDFDNDGTFEQTGETATHVFPNDGDQTFSMRVTSSTPGTLPTDPPVVSTVTEAFTINVNAPPVASFTTSPSAPVSGQEILFTSTATDPTPGADDFQYYDWDFDNNGSFEVRTQGPSATHTFGAPGTYTVGHRVRDATGSDSDPVTQTVTVSSPPPGNVLPVARFSVSDANPLVGQQVSFESSSSDPDGSIVSQRWDLDGDGDFDENVQGRNAFTSYSSPGPKIVRLEVRDSSGAVQTDTRNINVRALPVRTSRRLSLMSPFPIVRFVGSFLPNGARVELLEVKGPRGMRVNVRCAGRDCPVKQVSKRKRGRKPVRVRAFNRFMRKGTVLVVRVRKGELIGKYSRILIRGGKPPKARHLCLLPGKRKGSRCPRGRRRG